jgi:hypothetical protein
LFALASAAAAAAAFCFWDLVVMLDTAVVSAVVVALDSSSAIFFYREGSRLCAARRIGPLPGTETLTRLAVKPITVPVWMFPLILRVTRSPAVGVQAVASGIGVLGYWGRAGAPPLLGWLRWPVVE